MKNSIKFLLQRLLGYPNYLYLFARFMIKKLPFDKRERDFMYLLSFISSGDTVLDIGANIGVMTYHLAKKAVPGHVFAIEPVPSNIRVIRQIMTKYQLTNVSVYPCAVGEENGYAKMILPQIGGVLYHGLAHIKGKQQTEQGREVEVPIKRIDDIPELKAHKIAAIKLDVEESEYSVLKGAKGIIAANKPVIYCELWNTKNRFQTFDLMLSMGYKAWIYNHGKLVPADVVATKQNFFFLPDNQQ